MRISSPKIGEEALMENTSSKKLAAKCYPYTKIVMVNTPEIFFLYFEMRFVLEAHTGVRARFCQILDLNRITVARPFSSILSITQNTSLNMKSKHRNKLTSSDKSYFGSNYDPPEEGTKSTPSSGTYALKIL